MRIVLNHVTRMRAPRICVAGVDEQSGRHVRPTTGQGDLITNALLAERGGPLALGALVDLGSVAACPAAPEVEDHRCATEAMELIRRLDADEYLDLLHRVSEDDLEAIFGPDLERRKWKYAVDAGRGLGSLGVLRVSAPPELEVDDRYGGLQLRLNLDSEPPAYLRVTDVRFVEQDHQTIRRDVVEDVQRRLHRGVDALVMVGLARPFRAAGDDRNRHWLQANGICLVDRALGDAP